MTVQALPITDDSGDIVTPISLYINHDRFVRRWGLKMLSIVTNKDNPKSLSVTAIQDAYTFADGEVDQALRSKYKVPLDFSPNNGLIPPTVEGWASIIAFNYLYETRGWEERLKASNRLSVLIRETYADMALYRAGVKHLKAIGSGGGRDIVTVTTRRQDWLNAWGRYGVPTGG